MGLDLRIPIGLMFSLFGLLLSGFGLFSNKAIYKASLGININLGWGLIMLAFGVIMMLLGLKGSRHAPSQTPPPGASSKSTGPEPIRLEKRPTGDSGGFSSCREDGQDLPAFVREYLVPKILSVGAGTNSSYDSAFFKGGGLEGF